MNGVGCEQMLESPESAALQDALRQSLADQAGVPFDSVDVKFPGCDAASRRSMRRGLSIKISFTIKVQSASVGTGAVTALNSAVSTGALASSFQTEAAARDTIVAVQAQVITVQEETVVIATVTKAGTSDGVYYTFASICGSLVVLMITLWVRMVYQFGKSPEDSDDAQLTPKWSWRCSWVGAAATCTPSTFGAESRSEVHPGLEMNTLSAPADDPCHHDSQPSCGRSSGSGSGVGSSSAVEPETEARHILHSAALYCGYIYIA